MKLEQIGFYTLSNDRALTANSQTRLSRCELILTNKCNFKCPYCRKMGDEISFEEAENTIRLWASHNLFAIRFSGGEPTLYHRLSELVKLAKGLGIIKIALSTNGSASLETYKELFECGINDFSISLDACCSSDGEKMTGGINGAWEKTVSNIRELSKISYVTVGVVLTESNSKNINEIITFIDSLGVSDIRVIPAAQNGCNLNIEYITNSIKNKYPILNYRLNNIKSWKPVRSISENDFNKCPLVLDDMIVSGNKHYPCVIYFREGGKPIGEVGNNMRDERLRWFKNHNSHEDAICKRNCLDVCVDYNNRWKEFHE